MRSRRPCLWSLPCGWILRTLCQSWRGPGSWCRHRCLFPWILTAPWMRWARPIWLPLVCPGNFCSFHSGRCCRHRRLSNHPLLLDESRIHQMDPAGIHRETFWRNFRERIRRRRQVEDSLHAVPAFGPHNRDPDPRRSACLAAGLQPPGCSSAGGATSPAPASLAPTSLAPVSGAPARTSSAPVSPAPTSPAPCATPPAPGVGGPPPLFVF